ncbi:hypothetical protein CRE_00394 [Caenorhabditis remanei]|uniref:Uncharacterized protein n=2 Tax=Caenorhabditis remanei TaxID=31234 RepID=E3LEW6_CAERE|nr:hypothetical protein CRE_00394 [Caenorhabditis remanei]
MREENSISVQPDGSPLGLQDLLQQDDVSADGDLRLEKINDRDGLQCSLSDKRRVPMRGSSSSAIQQGKGIKPAKGRVDLAIAKRTRRVGNDREIGDSQRVGGRTLDLNLHIECTQRMPPMSKAASSKPQLRSRPVSMPLSIPSLDSYEQALHATLPGDEAW